MILFSAGGHRSSDTWQPFPNCLTASAFAVAGKFFRLQDHRNRIISAEVINRLQALCLLWVVGIVLPMSGTAQRFCMAEFQFASTGGTCEPCEEHNHCDCSGDEDPGQPGCIAAAKPLPDALQPVALAVPTPLVFDLHAQPFISVPMETAGLSPAAPTRDRGPPGNSRLYLSNRSLLL
jgi:hypothetical protein